MAFCRSLDSSLFNKANEIEEDISMKRFDLRVAQIHIAAVKAQVSCYLGMCSEYLFPFVQFGVASFIWGFRDKDLRDQ